MEIAEQAKLARVVKLMSATCLWRCLQGWRMAADQSQKKRIRSVLEPESAREMPATKAQLNALRLKED